MTAGGRFRLSSRALGPARLAAALGNHRAGALCTFEGWVRNRNDGRKVRRLEYSAFASMAVKQGERIVAEALRRFAVVDVVCVHRVGTLKLGDLAVWVGVTAEHRAAAFEACRYVIDEIKARVPIWKKEFYASGDSGWVDPTKTNLEHGTRKMDRQRNTRTGRKKR